MSPVANVTALSPVISMICGGDGTGVLLPFYNAAHADVSRADMSLFYRNKASHTTLRIPACILRECVGRFDVPQHIAECAMARPVWEGDLRLSLVTCPVSLFNATTSAGDVSFHLLHKKTH